MASTDHGTAQLGNFLSDDRIVIDPVRTEEDQEVWGTLVRILGELWRSREPSFYPDYLFGIGNLNISSARIPSLSEVNQMLSAINWSAVYVDGMVEDHLYQEMQAAHIFPVARHIRRKRDIFHSAAPDFIHDVVGHLPMLFSAAYKDLLEDWAHRAVEARPDPRDAEISKALAELIEEREKDCPDPGAIEAKTAVLSNLHNQANTSPSRAARFARFYAWAIEFGITAGPEGSVRISGSAALSSPEEFNRIVSGQTRLLPFVENAIECPVNYAAVQHTMFIANDFSEYHDVLAEI
jgi:phenylalanine-4-hydroxylase